MMDSRGQCAGENCSARHNVGRQTILNSISKPKSAPDASDATRITDRTRLWQSRRGNWEESDRNDLSLVNGLVKKEFDVGRLKDESAL